MSTGTLVGHLFEPDLEEDFDFSEDWLEQDGPFYDLMRQAREEVEAAEGAADVVIDLTGEEPAVYRRGAPKPLPGKDMRRGQRRRQTVTHHKRRQRLAQLRADRIEAERLRQKRARKQSLRLLKKRRGR